VKWTESGGGSLGDRSVEVRSLKLADGSGVVRRYRTCTVFKDGGSFSRTPAFARLFKSDKGHIGALVTGKNMGSVKIGKNYFLQQSVLVGLNSLSKKTLKSLVRNTAIEILDLDGITVGIEK